METIDRTTPVTGGSVWNIRPLPLDLVNKIAAGEVVERPGSAMKELLENSLDAGATEIIVRLKDGGKSLIEIVDNGSGIPAHEIPLALERHATSKIRSIDDLLNVRSMGFRGEALAAIASVSQLTLHSRFSEERVATSFTSLAGKLRADSQKPRSVGTTISVKNLFFNTPARLKFLKTSAAETNFCLQIFQRIALANANVRLSLEVDGTIKYVYPECETDAERTAQVFSSFLRSAIAPEKLICFERTKPDISVRGFLLPMEYCTQNSRGIFTFVNKRVVKDKMLTQAILAGAKEVLFGVQYPVITLMLETTPERVDVNVHPTKAEVRFSEPSPFGLIRVAVREALAKMHTPRNIEPPSPTSPDRERFEPAALPMQLGRSFREKNSFVAERAIDPLFQSNTQSISPSSEAATADMPPELQRYNEKRILGLVHSTYIVCEDETGLMLVDQHAAHERVTYERLRRTKFILPLASQALLIPIIVELEGSVIDELEAKFIELKDLGLGLDRFGPEQVRIDSLPALLLRKNGTPRMSVPKLIRTFAERILDDLTTDAVAETLQSVLLETLASEACHGSVRAGQSLSSVEIQALLSQMDEADFGAHCPHGRPTTVRLSWTEIEKLFKRKL